MASSIAHRTLGSSRILLILDRSRFVRAACARYFRAYFDQVVECETEFEVDAELARTPVTDLIYGHVVENGWGVAERVGRWRSQQPQLRRVVLSTASLEAPSFEGVDLVVTKPFEPRALVDLFLAERRETGVGVDSLPSLATNQWIGD